MSTWESSRSRQVLTRLGGAGDVAKVYLGVSFDVGLRVAFIDARQLALLARTRPSAGLSTHSRGRPRGWKSSECHSHTGCMARRAGSVVSAALIAGGLVPASARGLVSPASTPGCGAIGVAGSCLSCDESIAITKLLGQLR
jgi:hypothetical protein